MKGTKKQIEQAKKIKIDMRKQLDFRLKRWTKVEEKDENDTWRKKMEKERKYYEEVLECEDAGRVINFYHNRSMIMAGEHGTIKY